MKSILVFLTSLYVASAYAQTSPTSANPTTGSTVPETVVVIGESLPQVLLYTKDLTLIAAIGNAGGITAYRDTRIYVIRDGRIFFENTIKEILRSASPDGPLLKPKDVVYLR